MIKKMTGSIGSCGDVESHGVIFASGVHPHGASAQDSQSQAQEELDSVASAVQD
ncbi:MAG: hypothetical protein J07HQX50_01592 [Haloquadratum sp. J07HQX50]|nr:MAG: hypothetical protein J07HQX50_01592 [Haloquadratum sp. J07HQX50]